MQTTSWKPFWKAFPILALVPIVALVAYANAVIADHQRELRHAEHLAVELELEAVNRGLSRVTTDVCTLANQNELAEYLESTDAGWLDAMQSEYLNLAANVGLYDQIRFLDEQGMEVVRINFNNGAPYAAAEEELQDKSGRYYFAEALTLQPGEVYVSPLDLNVEHGAIEVPHKPMIRIGTPVTDTAGQIRGVILINFLAQSMLDRVVASGALSTGDPIMLNEEGYWLVSPDPPTNWGFMFPAHAENRLPVIDPVAWDYLRDRSRGDIVTDWGLLTFDSYSPLAEIGNCVTHVDGTTEGNRAAGYRWILASHVPAERLARIERDAIVVSMAIGVPLLFLLAVGTRSVSVVAEQRRRHQARLETLARFDSLTDLANRTTFEERLAQEHLQARRHRRRFAVLYLDLDGFKAVNDSLGHQTGDDVLIAVARAIESCSRAVDIPARLGGDEFVLLLSEIGDAEAAQRVARRVRDCIAGLSNDRWSIDVSIGVAVWPDHAEDATQAIRLADEAMYAAKAAGRGRICMAKAA